MKLPNMDTRMISRVPNSHHFTVEALSNLGNGRTICNHCGIERCAVRNYAQRLPRKGYSIKVESCEAFVPVLGFSVLQGLNLETWNTIRVGEAWSKRLYPGKRVAIGNMVSGLIEAYAKVQSVDSGRLATVIIGHAKNNHAIQAELASGKIKHEEVVERMLRILKNAYGTNIASPDRMTSVIYLQLEK